MENGRDLWAAAVHRLISTRDVAIVMGATSCARNLPVLKSAPLRATREELASAVGAKTAAEVIR